MDKAQQEAVAAHINSARDKSYNNQRIGSLIRAVAELADLTLMRNGGALLYQPRESEEEEASASQVADVLDKTTSEQVEEATRALADLEHARGPVTEPVPFKMDPLPSGTIVDIEYGKARCTFCERRVHHLKFLADGHSFCSASCVVSYRERNEPSKFPLSIQTKGHEMVQGGRTYRVLVGPEFTTLLDADAFMALVAHRIGDEDT